MSDAVAALTGINARIAAAALEVKRPASSVALIAVTKTYGPDAAEAAYAGGLTDVGENRVQEALEKMPLVSAYASSAE